MQDGSGRLRLGSTVDQSGKRKGLDQEATALLVLFIKEVSILNAGRKTKSLLMSIRKQSGSVR
jgi:hypothetical protein